MKIAVVNGTQKRGVTYRLKELFLEGFENASVTEFYLPGDAPVFCCGCARCVTEGEEACKDCGQISPIRRAIEEADLLVFTSPAYVLHATGAMKAFLDHCATYFLPHRPREVMFSKRAVVITQCLGAGGRSAAKDIKDSLSWWGISRIGVYSGALMGDIVWENLPEKRRIKLEKGIKKLAGKFTKADYSRPARVGTKVKIKFMFSRMIIKSIFKDHPESKDAVYWQKCGWLGKARPWKR